MPVTSNIRHYGHWVAQEFGLSTLAAAGKDVYILIITRFLRMFAYGAGALVLALYFQALGFSDDHIGLFMTFTLLGDVLLSLLLTLIADKIGRRTTLLLGAVMMTVSGAVFATTDNYFGLLTAAIFGVISPSGNEIGPFRAIEESTLAHLTEASKRSDVFVWYVVAAVLGTSSGLALGGWIVDYCQSSHGWTAVDSYRAIFWIYTGIGLVKIFMAFLLSKQCEREPEKPQLDDSDETRPLLSSRIEPEQPRNRSRLNPFVQISARSRWTLLRLCSLFFLDSLASGIVPFSLINYYMDRKFHLPKQRLGGIMSGTWVVSSVGNIFASSLAKRIGLIQTMVFTHLPSAVFLGLLPAPSSLALTICLLVGRATLSSMDQAPRSAFLSAVVLPEERTAVMGIVNVVKTLSQSGGPVITGVLAGRDRFWIAFVVAGSLKASYDVGMLAWFLNVKLQGHEEREENIHEAASTEEDPQESLTVPRDARISDDDESGGKISPTNSVGTIY